jgi:hypothetical protein
MRSSRISNATHLQMLKAVGAIEVFAPNGGLWAVFDAEHQLIGQDGVVEGTAPTLTCLTDDYTTLQLKPNDPIQVGEVGYRVAEHQPDGTGESIVILKR